MDFLIGNVIWSWAFFALTLFTGQSYLQFPTVLLPLEGRHFVISPLLII